MAKDRPLVLKVKYSSDPQVQAFVDREAWDLGPYRREPIKTASEVFMAARAHFGDYRCLDLTIYHH
jgi:hypothetical protein